HAPSSTQRFRRGLRTPRRNRNRRDPRCVDRRSGNTHGRRRLTAAAVAARSRLGGAAGRCGWLRDSHGHARRGRDASRVSVGCHGSARRGWHVSAAIDVRDQFRVHQTPEGDAAALQRLSLTVLEREVVTVLGPSGSGKSTLLRILAGLDRPSAGTVRVFGVELGKLPATDVARYRTRTVGYADQHYARALSPELTARELVGLELGLAGANHAERAHRA